MSQLCRLTTIEQKTRQLLRNLSLKLHMRTKMHFIRNSRPFSFVFCTPDSTGQLIDTMTLPLTSKYYSVLAPTCKPTKTTRRVALDTTITRLREIWSYPKSKKYMPRFSRTSATYVTGTELYNGGVPCPPLRSIHTILKYGLSNDERTPCDRNGR